MSQGWAKYLKYRAPETYLTPDQLARFKVIKARHAAEQAAREAEPIEAVIDLDADEIIRQFEAEERNK